MNKQQLIEKVESLDERTTSASLIKDEMYSNFEAVGTINTEGFDGEQFQDGTAKIFKIEDAYVIVIDTDEEDFVYYESQIDDAQKTATDKLYYHTFNQN